MSRRYRVKLLDTLATPAMEHEVVTSGNTRRSAERRARAKLVREKKLNPVMLVMRSVTYEPPPAEEGQ